MLAISRRHRAWARALTGSGGCTKLRRACLGSVAGVPGVLSCISSRLPHAQSSLRCGLTAEPAARRGLIPDLGSKSRYRRTHKEAKMTDCTPDHQGNITCPSCGNVYSGDSNCHTVPAPSGSGGCTKRCHCPSCGDSCCMERDRPGLKPW